MYIKVSMFKIFLRHWISFVWLPPVLTNEAARRTSGGTGAGNFVLLDIILHYLCLLFDIQKLLDIEWKGIRSVANFLNCINRVVLVPILDGSKWFGRKAKGPEAKLVLVHLVSETDWRRLRLTWRSQNQLWLSDLSWLRWLLRLRRRRHSTTTILLRPGSRVITVYDTNIEHLREKKTWIWSLFLQLVNWNPSFIGKALQDLSVS